MKVLIIGYGGREHALAWLASRSQAVSEVLVFGDNAGMLAEPKVRRVGDWPKKPEEQVSAAWHAASEGGVDLTIVGPEALLAEGIVDTFQASHLSIFGPTAAAAQLETSKWFAKEVMLKARVPTAPVVKFSKAELEATFRHLLGHELPVVIKADGLCAGKGVRICRDFAQVVDAVHRCFIVSDYGAAGDTILVERYLPPHHRLARAELSILALVDIQGNFLLFPAAQDYKSVNDGDRGDNTGGMGAFAPVPWVTEAMMQQIGEKIFAPTIAEMKKRGTPFSGVLYAGLIWTADGPKVIEFNVRFGDPEIQPLAMLLQTDLIPVLKTIADGGSIADVKLKWTPGFAVCVNLVSRGYPGAYRTGFLVSGLADNDISGLARLESAHPADRSGWKVFHAGTKRSGGQVVTSGGRVLGVTKIGRYLPDTAKAIYAELCHIAWGDGQGTKPYARFDIGIDVPTQVD